MAVYTILFTPSAMCAVWIATVLFRRAGLAVRPVQAIRIGVADPGRTERLLSSCHLAARTHEYGP